MQSTVEKLDFFLINCRGVYTATMDGGGSLARRLRLLGEAHTTRGILSWHWSHGFVSYNA
jgi:hypothetical protein